MIGNLPDKYSSELSSVILDATNKSLMDAYDKIAILSPRVQELRKIPQSERDRLASITPIQRSEITVLETCSQYFDAGFGGAIISVSGDTTSEEALQFDKSTSKAIALEESIRAKVLKIPKINPETKMVDSRAEIPNWSKSAGAEALLWTKQSGQKIINMIISQIRSNVQVISEFKKSVEAGAQVSRGKCAEVATALLHTHFLFGMFAGYEYAKGSEISSMEKVQIAGRDFSPAMFVKKVEEIFRGRNVNAIIARAIASTGEK